MAEQAFPLVLSSESTSREQACSHKAQSKAVVTGHEAPDLSFPAPSLNTGVLEESGTFPVY